MINFIELYFYFLIVLFGACFGSFLNVVVYRLPKGIFLNKARSYCPACNESLKWQDLVPVFSFLLLRGRCRFCKMKISPRYPIVEALCAAFAAVSYLRFGFDWSALLAFFFLAVLTAVTLIDYDTMEIPYSLIVSLAVLAVFSVWVDGGLTLAERIIGFFTISLPMLIIIFVVYKMSGLLAFGFGDVFLVAVCGFILGWKCVLLSFFIALLTGGGYAIYLLLSGKRKRNEHIPFGPYLCLGFAVAFFFGSEIIRYYLSLFIF